MASAPLAPPRSATRQIVQRHDPDRYLTALFAPDDRRDALFTLYAFNHELARAPEVAREPAMALIRLQWWREVVEGAARPHPVASPLAACLAARELDPAELLAMIEAREREVEGGFATLPAWRSWLLQGAGSLSVAAGRLLGAPAAALDRLRALGAGYGAAGLLGNMPVLARAGRCLLPEDLLAQHGATARLVIDNPLDDTLAPVLHSLAGEGLALLGAPQAAGRAWLAAGLPAVLARRDLRRPPRNGPRSLGDRLAVTGAALRGLV